LDCYGFCRVFQGVAENDVLKRTECLMMWQCSNGVMFWRFIGLNYNIFLLIWLFIGLLENMFW
jgi:hypothetical protein